MKASDARSHLHAELSRCAVLLGGRLRALRDRGRSSADEAMQGFVIEEGEAEGLVAELTARWGRPPPSSIAEAAQPLFAATQSGFLPLYRAIRQFDLGVVEYDALLLALAVEVDGMFGRLIAYLNDHVARARPTIGMALSLHDTGQSPLAFCERPVVRDGLLEIEGDGPAPGWSVLVSRDIVLRLTGEVPPDALPAGFRCFSPADDLLDRLVLAPNVRDGLMAWKASARTQEAFRPLILAGLPGSGRTTAARGITGGLGWKLLVVEVPADQSADRLRAARREANWHDAPLLLRLVTPDAAGAMDWRRFWEGLAGLWQPVMIAAVPRLAAALAAAAPQEPAMVTFPDPSSSERAALWRALLPGDARLGPEVADHLASRFRFNPGRIARAVRRATAAGLSEDALVLACREVGAASIGPLAQKLLLPYAWDDLVVPSAVREELELARVWLRQQHQVLDVWGFGRRVTMGRGLTMLFGGPPGTGKTMAAQVLAGALALDLYRVDLSRVVNKYIGETEKHLSQLFDEGYASGAALFFDEADALFGKRSEVKDAHDRYANLEIGYLLQRMEEYEGVTILASNRARDMDEAFTRRFQFIIDFPIPDEAHRLKIWQGMLPAEAEQDGALDLAGLAKRFETSGGEIKNAMLAAAFLAAGERVPLCTRHLVQAVRREFRKGGRLVGERG
jgi:hypothetical protein